MGLSVKFLVGNDGIMRGIKGEVDEEWLVRFLIFDPLDGFLGDGGEDVVGIPALGHRSGAKAAGTGERF